MKIRKIVSVLCVVIFAAHFANRQFYAHNHVTGGIAITHSHFHTDSHNDTDCGGHSKESILFIARIAQFDCTNTSNICTPAPLLHFPHQKKYVEVACQTASIHLQNPTLRAPPAI